MNFQVKFHFTHCSGRNVTERETDALRSSDVIADMALKYWIRYILERALHLLIFMHIYILIVISSIIKHNNDNWCVMIYVYIRWNERSSDVIPFEERDWLITGEVMTRDWRVIGWCFRWCRNEQHFRYMHPVNGSPEV